MGKAEETRQYIIEQSAPIFNKHGYAGTSMSQLTKAINMTKGAIYGNFKDKDEIALAAFDYNFNQINDNITNVLQLKENSCDKLIAFANYHLDHFAELSQNGGCPILNAAIDSDNVHQQLKDRVANTVVNWIDSVSRIVYKGIKMHQIDRNVKPEQFASLFVSLIEGGIMLSKVTGNTIHLSRNVDHIIHMVNTGLRI